MTIPAPHDEPEPHALHLARAHHHQAHADTANATAWEDLTDAERIGAEHEAGRWLTAAAAAGLIHAPGPGPDDMEELPRRILEVDTDHALYDDIAGTAHRYGTVLPSMAVHDIAVSVCNRVGILTAPPDPEPDTCTAQIADADGWWLQCTEKPGHDPATAHDADGEMAWPDGAPESVPARPTTEASK